MEMTGEGLETGMGALQGLREFAWVQTTNVLNSGRQVLDWYLTRAAESPLLARLTQAVAETSSHLKPTLADSDKGADTNGLFPFVGLLGGVVLGAGVGIYRARHSKESPPIAVSSIALRGASGGLIGMCAGIIFELNK